MKIQKRADLLKTAKNISLVLAGTLLVAFGTAVFILPFHMVVGGMSGLAILIHAALPFEAIGVDGIITILTWSSFLIGLFVLGRDFSMKTLISTVVYPPAVSLFLRLTEPDVLGGALNLSQSPHPELALMISALAGGACVGAGCAVTFLGGGSTGGVDIIAFSLCRFFPRLKSPRVIFVLDASIILLGFLLAKDLLLSLLGVISALISVLVIDKVFLGGATAFVAQIVTDEADAITQAVIEKMERTTTVLNVKGGFTGEPKSLVLVSFSMRQYADLIRLVNLADPNAFVSVHKAYEINGEGWTK